MKQSLEHARSVGKASSKGNTRTAGREQFYTPVSLAERLVEVVGGIVPDLCDRVLVEPAAGTGNFLQAFEKSGNTKVIAVDVDPRFQGVQKANFLTEFTFPAGTTDAVAITNPPFGRNNSLSVPFFNKLADHCEFIAFVIPRSWRKWSVQARLDKRFHLVYDEVLEVDYIDENGVEVSSNKGGLNTVFQVWQRKNFLRESVIVPNYGLIEKTVPSEADVSLTLFGRGCGKVRKDFDRIPNKSKLFFEGFESCCLGST